MTIFRRTILPITALQVVQSAGIALSIVMTPPPVRAERVCGPPECYTAECWWVGPGHRRCRRECRRRCTFYHPPIHYERPRYAAPYVSPAPVYSGPVIPTEIVGLGILAVVGAVIVGIISAMNGSTNSEVAVFEAAMRATQDAARSHRADARDHDAHIKAITSHIAAEEHDAFEQGQRDADEEWRRLTGE